MLALEDVSEQIDAFREFQKTTGKRKKTRCEKF